ncbi:MAG: RDD family protein [Rickettsiales bacterium]|nr:RDD family protein [Rickettsiales bacterium]
MNEPSNDNQIDYSKIHYAGFSIRFLAQIIDSIFIMILFIPLGYFLPNAKNDMPPEIVEAYEMHSQNQISDEELTNIAAPYLINDFLPNLLTYFIIQLAIVGVIFIILWKYKSTSPGKGLLNLKIIDATSLKPLSTMQSILRFFGYFISIIPFMFGFTMIMFTKKKQGLHDKIANSIVVYNKAYSEDWEKKKFKYQTYFFLTTLILLIIIITTR